jgi:hypothetical protein
MKCFTLGGLHVVVVYGPWLIDVALFLVLGANFWLTFTNTRLRGQLLDALEHWRQFRLRDYGPPPALNKNRNGDEPDWGH